MLIAVLVIQALTLTLPAIGLNHHHGSSSGPEHFAASAAANEGTPDGEHRHALTSRHWHDDDAGADLIVDDDLIEDVLDELLTRLAASGMPMTRVSAQLHPRQPWLMRSRGSPLLWPPTWSPDVPHRPPIV